MRQIRLLPIVIAAGLALLVFKGAGIMSGTGYVLTGASSSVAASGAPGTTDDPEGSSLPTEPMLVDAAPTLDDSAPTLMLEGGGQGEGGSTALGNEVAALPDLEQPAAAARTEDCPTGDQSVLFAGDCNFQADGEAPPRAVDAAGSAVPLGGDAGASGSEGAILERLAERRQELDSREAELDMRLALVEAAERRIEERTLALAAIEARINAMVDERRVMEEAQFAAVVAMYETMKPKDAAAIFDELDMGVLLRVARALSPRKMAPIMARMNPTKARDLTAGLAIEEPEPTLDVAEGGLAALPQIVGQ